MPWIRRLAIVFFLFCFWSSPSLAGQAAIRIGLTPAILHDRQAAMADFGAYLERKTGRKVELVLRDSYRQIIDLITQDQLDFAWVSAYPFVYLQQHANLRLLATPLFHGRPFFRAYLIVPADDMQTDSLLSLRGKFFAYADLYSHTGYLVPRYELRQAGEDPASFFARTFFTGGHKKVVRAVASGLADAGSVDSFVWDTLALVEPELTAQTRIVAKSGEYGFPPLVASRKVKAADFTAMRAVLLGMAGDPQAAALLDQLNINGFVAGETRWYAEVARMMRIMGTP